MKSILSAICCLAACSVFAFSQKAKAPTNDQKFVDFAAQTDMVEANLGTLAESVAASDSVKEYGQMLATDHTNDYQKLQAAAQQAGLMVPTAIDAAHNKSMIGPMQALKGAGFDKKFSHEMVVGHTQAIAMYKKEAADSQSPALKAYAENALATLQEHLDKAKDLDQMKTKSK